MIFRNNYQQITNKSYLLLIIFIIILRSITTVLADSFVWQTNDNQLYKWGELLEESFSVDDLLNWSALGYYKVNFNLPLSNGGEIIGDWFLLDNNGNCGENFMERTSLDPNLESYFYQSFHDTNNIPLDLGENITSNPFILANDLFEIFLTEQSYNNSEELTQLIGEYFLNNLDTSSWEKNRIKRKLKLWFDNGQGETDWFGNLTLVTDSFWWLMWQDSTSEPIYNIQDLHSLPIGTIKKDQCWLLVFYNPIKTVIPETIDNPYYTKDNGATRLKIANCDDNDILEFDPVNLIFPNICYDYSLDSKTIIRWYSLDFIVNNNGSLEWNIQEEDQIVSGETPLLNDFFLETLGDTLYNWGEFIMNYQYERELLKKLDFVGSYKANFNTTLSDWKLIEGKGLVVGDTNVNCGINFIEKDNFAPIGESYLYALFENQGVLPFPVGDVSEQDFVLNWLETNSLFLWSEIKTLFESQVDTSGWDKNKVKNKLEIGLPDSETPTTNFWSGKVNLEESFWWIFNKETVEKEIFNIEEIESLNFRSRKKGECGLLVLNKAIKITIPENLLNPYYSLNNGLTRNSLNPCDGNPDLEYNGEYLPFGDKCYHYTDNGTKTVVWTYNFKEWLTNQGTNFSLMIEAGDAIVPTEPIEAGGPTNINWIIPTSWSNSSIEINLDEYLRVRDLVWLDTGYDVSLQISDLTSLTGDALPAQNISITIPSSENITIALEGTNNNRVEIPNEVGEIGNDFVSLETPQIWVKRDTGENYSTIGTYGVKPIFKIDIPKYKKPGIYSGEIVYTIFNY